MKKSMKIFSAISTAALILLAAGCEEWTTPESLEFERSLTESSHGDAMSTYYKNLRAYKLEKKHTICFGWFSDWTGVGTDAGGKLMGMPDSVDVVSMWGNWHSLSPEKKEDLRRVQEIKGTRVMMCFIIANIGDQTTPSSVRNDHIVDGVQYNSEAEAMAAFWGWYGNYGDTSEEGIEKACRKYARSILDTIAKYNWDGFDFDLEPSYGSPGNIASYQNRIGFVIDEMSKELGPESGTKKLLCVDGQPYSISAESAQKLDYFILQAYYDSYYTNTDSRVNTMLNAFSSIMTREEIMSKIILTSDFESCAANGGTRSGWYTDRNGKQIPQIYGYATYTYPNLDARIGGFGAYRFGFDYSNGNNYGYIRKAIQLANPALEVK